MEMEEFLSAIDNGTLSSTTNYIEDDFLDDLEFIESISNNNVVTTTVSSTTATEINTDVITTTAPPNTNNINDSVIEFIEDFQNQENDENQSIEETIVDNNVSLPIDDNGIVIPPIDYVLNTKTIIDQSRLRFSSAPWMEYVSNCSITCGGAGGIMSWTILLLSRLNPLTIRIFDPDVFSEVNMAGQFVTTNDIGFSKVDTMVKWCFEFSNYFINGSKIKITENSNLNNIVISGFDSMESRKIVFNRWKKNIDDALLNNTDTINLKDFLYIDGRLAAENFQIFCFNGSDTEYIKLYEDNYLFNDSQADAVSCSYKQTSHIAAMIASFIVSTFVTYCRNRSLNMDLSIIPFLREYDAVFNIDNQII